ncbi:MAG TPA: hypothetical protein VGM90_26795 [Kofleriaceae bacterium]|jgi:hypothetical protein
MRFVLLAIALVGCATSAPDDPFDATLGAADSSGTEVTEAKAGDHLTLSFAEGEIAALHTDAPAAVIVRKTSGTIDPYALVKNLDKQKLGESHDQVIAPALGAKDAIAGVTGDAIAFIASEGLHGAGTITVDIVPLQRALPSSIEGGIAKVIGNDLRALEPARAEAVANGYLVERDDGGLDIVNLEIPLDQRSTVSALGARIHEDRMALANELGLDLHDYAAVLAIE